MANPQEIYKIYNNIKKDLINLGISKKLIINNHKNFNIYKNLFNKLINNESISEELKFIIKFKTISQKERLLFIKNNQNLYKAINKNKTLQILKEIKNIKDEVEELLKKKENKIKIINKKYKNFEEKYPILYISIIKESINEDTFKFMLNMLEKQKKTKNKKKIDIEVGTYMVDKFVKPFIKKKK